MSYKQKAYKRGEDAAIAAASWVIDGNTSQEHIRRMVKWFDDGDPQYSQYLPTRPNLTGGWNKDLTSTKLYEEIAGKELNNPTTLAEFDSKLFEELCESFEEGVADHFESECERILKAALRENQICHTVP